MTRCPVDADGKFTNDIPEYAGRWKWVYITTENDNTVLSQIAGEHKWSLRALQVMDYP